MPMNEEENSSSAKPAAPGGPERNPPGQKDAGQQKPGLPGLSGFGGVQGYAPVTSQPQAGAPAAGPEPEPEPELPASFEEEHVPGVLGQESSGHSEYTEAQYTGAVTQETGAEASYVSGDGSDMQDDFENYVPQQDPAPGGQQHATPYDDAGTSLQTFEAHYGQHPEIPLDAFEDPGQAQAAQPLFHETGQAGDAEFVGGESVPDAAEPKERRGRRILMAASGLIGMLALGGALAFAYKIGGDSDIASAGKPPLIQADSRPVKRAPDKPGGKQFPHKNKKIYERLQGSSSDEVERLVSRQEKVTAATTAAINGENPALKAEAITPVAPRKVRTLTVRPDGTIEAVSPRQKIVKAPAPPPAAPEPSEDGETGIALSLPQAPASAVQAPVKPNIPKPVAVTPPPAAPQKVAVKPPVKKPVPPAAAPAPAPRKIASRPAASPSASSSEYVVQVASRKSQTGALAAFADIQQKYPRLLSGYRPIIKRADLGDKGVWYRLNVGPIESKKVASALCGQLKSAGMRSCIVRTQ